MVLKSGKRSGRSRKIAFEHYNPICVWCGVSISDLLEVAHIDHDRSNDDPKNLVFLCLTHHRMLDLGLIPDGVVTQLRDRPLKADWSILIKGVPNKTLKKPTEKKQIIILPKMTKSNDEVEPSLPSMNIPESEIEKKMIRRREAALKAWATRRLQNPKKYGKPTKQDQILLQKIKEKKIDKKVSNKFEITRSLAAYKAQRTRKLQNPKKYGKITEELIKNIRQLEEKLFISRK